MLSVATKAAVALLFALYGARLSPQQAWHGVRQWKLHALVLATTFVVFPLLGLAARVLVPGVLALVFGWLAFRSRVTGVYLSIITQALSFALMLAFFRNDMGFGGNNGFTDFKDIAGFNLQSPSTRVALLELTAMALAA